MDKKLEKAIKRFSDLSILYESRIKQMDLVIEKLEEKLGQNNNNTKRIVKFLKTKDVEKIFGCNDDTIAAMRKNEELDCREINGTYYYPDYQFTEEFVKNKIEEIRNENQ